MAILIKKLNEEYYAIINDNMEIKEGMYKEYYSSESSEDSEDRRLKVQCYYSNNKLNGSHVVFNHDKTINKISNYYNGILEGIEIQYYYHFDKKSMRKSYYTNGKLHGKSKLYNDDGKLEWSIVYDNGKIKTPYKKHNKCIIL
jgi:antitoxin component YwqK of YwqJK toxin-antitoxin module